jgi:hypothetical protein
MEIQPDCDDLPPIERASCYRAYAEQMQSRAEHARTPEFKAAYLRVAADWLQLAADIEAQYGQVTVVIAPELASLLNR